MTNSALVQAGSQLLLGQIGRSLAQIAWNLSDKSDTEVII